jgi:hypothetical protein
MIDKNPRQYPSYFFPDFLIPPVANGPLPLAFSAISFLAWASAV